jgi:gamma-D-glutamyl-L-lysine dipeptidyl-peptidase
MDKGTCLLTYVPMRKEPNSASEMVNSLIFGESYNILESTNDWLRIQTDFDHYEGWISRNAYFEHQEFNSVCDTLLIEALGKQQRILIPCGANIPENGMFHVDGEKFIIEKKLKTNHHLPLPLRLTQTAKSFINTPYLWGGRTFMGIDCSGFMQVVFKSSGIILPRDTKQQIDIGTEVMFDDIKTCDLVLFKSLTSEHVSHVGMMLDKKHIIHASGKVKINELNTNGLTINGKLAYRTMAIKRII